MDFDISTPAVLFPAVSLLLLAYTNRFLALAGIIRNLHADYESLEDPTYIGQIENLRWRVRCIRNMQFWGVLSLLLCTICMFLVFFGLRMPAQWAFSLSLIAMMISLFLSLLEIQSSVRALDLHLERVEHPKRGAGKTGNVKPDEDVLA